MTPRDVGGRRFVVWMYSPKNPLWSIPESSLERLREALDDGWEVVSVEAELLATGDGPKEVPEAVLEAVADAEVYCGFGIPRPVFLAAEELRWVHSGAAGVGGSLYPEMVESDVLFTNSAGIHGEPLAEHALAAMLHFARGLDVAQAGQRRREWVRQELAGEGSPLHELSGRVVGVVGYGGIGRAVGRRAAALGMRVLGLRRHPQEGEGWDEVEEMLGPGRLPELLERSDAVVLALPETEETRELIGPAELSLLRPSSILINLSRGGIVNEASLVEALAHGRIRGAALDVFAKEPLPAASPLWEMTNVLITPHTGAISPRFWERETDLLLRNVRHYLTGEPLENLVDKRQGY